jgi:GNAT superfamily N-acetyltransferase
MALIYLTDGPVKPEEILVLLAQGGFPRPMDDPERTQKMVDHCSFYVTVRTDDDQLVGWIRVLTDYVYYGLVAEVAVDASHKGKGIGKEMLRIVRDVVTPKVTLVLMSSEEGEPFYAHLGWQRSNRSYRQRRTE